MRNLWRVGASVLAAGLMVTSIGYGTASADDRDEDSTKGDGESFGKFKFYAKNSSDDPFDATGYFESEGPGPFQSFFALNGPIKCLDVDGNRAGFIYTTKDDTMPFLVKNLEVKVTVEENDGAPDRIAFGLGVPEGTLQDCAPGATMNDVTSGFVEVHDSQD